MKIKWNPKSKVAYEEPLVSDVVDKAATPSPGVPSKADKAEVDEVFEGIITEDKKPNKPLVPAVAMDEDLGHIDIAKQEQTYKTIELQQKTAPLIQETVDTKVKETVKLNNERLKAEVNDVVLNDIGHRLDKYDRRRKRREMADMLGTVFRWGIAIFIALIIFGNAQLRTRIVIVAQDVKEMVICLVKNEEVSSNKLVEDLFRDLGDDVN